MATIIENNDPTPNRPVLVSQDSSGGWAVAIVVLVLIIVAGAFWYMRYYRAPAAPNNPGSTIQVNLPSSGYAPAPGSGSTQTQTQTPAPTTPTTH